LDKFVQMDKEDFIGKEALANQLAEGLKRKLVGVEMLAGGIPRNGYEVLAQGQKVGIVTTGNYAPHFKKSLALALIDIEYAEPGTSVEINIRGRQVPARVTGLNFYTKKYKK